MKRKGSAAPMPGKTTGHLRKIWELFWPYLAGGIVSVAALTVTSSHARNNIAAQLPTQTVTLVSILTAFIATSLTILLTAPNNPGIERLKTSPEAFRRLIKMHSEAIRIGILAAVFSLILLMVEKPFDGPIKLSLFGVWAFAVSATVGLFYRIVSLVQTLLSQ